MNNIELMNIGSGSNASNPRGNEMIQKALTNRFKNQQSNLFDYSLNKQKTNISYSGKKRNTLALNKATKPKNIDEDDEDEEVKDEKDAMPDEFLDFAEQKALLEAGGQVDDNMKHFMNKYGQNFELPSYYIKDSTIYPQQASTQDDIDTTYALILVAFGVPGVTTELQDQSYTLGYRTFRIDRSEGADSKYTAEPEDQDIDEVYLQEIYKNSSILLTKMNEGSLEIVNEVNLNYGRKIQMEFSPCGRYLIFYHVQKKNGYLTIWDIEDNDIEGCIAKIAESKQNPDIQPLYTAEMNNLKKLRNFRFSPQGDFFMCHDKKSLVVMDLNKCQDQDEFVVCSWQIDEDVFSKLHDARIIETDEDNNKGFKVKVACQQNEIKKVQFFEILDRRGDPVDQKNLDAEPDLTFTNEQDEAIKVYISEDFEQMLLLNKTENYLLEKNEKTHEIYQQTSLTWLNDKVVLFVKSKGSQFVISSCSDYDDDIQVQITSDKNLRKRKIKRNIEPGKIQFYDFDFKAECTDGEWTIDKISSVMRRDDEFFCDTFIGDEQKESIRYLYTKYRGVQKKWPYFVMQGLQTRVTDDEDVDDGIFVQASSMYQARVIFRIEFPIYEQLPRGIDQDDLTEEETKEWQKNQYVAGTYITDSNFLFVLLETKHSYNLYQFDLEQFEQSMIDHARIKSPEYIFGYTKDEVKDMYSEKTNQDVQSALPFKGIHVRAPNTRQKIKVNNKLIVMFHHQDCLLAWVQSTEEHLEWVSHVDSQQLHWHSDDHFLIRADEKSTFQLRDIRMSFSEISNETAFTYKQQTMKVQGYAYDFHARNVILVLTSRKKTGRVSQVQISNVDDGKIPLWKGKVTNNELIGRIKSNLFNFINGHIYYNNNVIKVRYDLLDKKGIKDPEEDQVFDYFEDILLLQDGERVKAKMPLTSQQNQRLLYMTFDHEKQLAPNRIIILPFLHERKIFLTQMDENYEYFYTCISVPNPDNQRFSITFFISINITQHKVLVFSQGGILIKAIDYSALAQDCGQPESVSESGQIFLFRKPQTMIVTCVGLYINLEQKEINLQKLKQIDLEKDILAYAEAQNSQNVGHLYLPKDEILNQQREYLKAKNNKLKLIVNDNMDMMATIKPKKQALVGLKGIGLQGQLRAQFGGKLIKKNAEQRKREAIQKKKELGELAPIIYMQRSLVNLDDTADTWDQVQNALRSIGIDSIIEDSFDPLEHQALFIAEPKQLDNGQLFGDQFGSGFIDLSMNKKFVFFFNTFRVWKMDITQPSKGFNNLNLYISPEEEQTQIKKLRCGSTDEKICVQVKQSENQDALILWDLENDIEIEAYDCNSNPKVFWDCKGDSYLADGNQILIMEQGVRLTCYDIKQINEQDERTLTTGKNLKFDYEYGHRFDHEGHSWVFLRDYISLAFSYMTFVIKKKFDETEVNYTSENFIFDLEQYNYLIGCKTALTETQQATADHDRLAYILQNFKDIDPILLEQIQYYHIEKKSSGRSLFSTTGSFTESALSPYKSASGDGTNSSKKLQDAQQEDEEVYSMSELREVEKQSKRMKLKQSTFRFGQQYMKVTPLYIAWKQRNNRSVKILLQYMGALDYNATEAVKEILPQLIDFAGFKDYLEGMPFQTIQMQSKQTLRVKGKYREDIVQINSAITSYIDGDYYIQHMGEERKTENIDPEYKNYPVKVEALRANWILDNSGKRFFNQILQSEQLDIYSIKAIQMFIEFLYMNVKGKIMWMRGIPYIFQVIAFYGLIYSYEHQFKMVQSVPDNKLMLQLKDPTQVGPGLIAVVFGIFNIGTSSYPFLFLYRQAQSLKWAILKNPFNYIDIVGSLLSFYISVSIFGNCGIRDGRPQTGWHHYRFIAAITSILIMLKSLYFLKLIDQIAPLIFIIFKIFNDIRYFMIVFMVILLSFMVAFYLIGQVQADQVPEEKEKIAYASFGGAMQYIWYISIGELSADDNLFSITDSLATQIVLWVLFSLATFLILIHMLNMLIAVMTDTFTLNNENKQETMLKEHLQFVVDNWFILKANKREAYSNYLVAAWVNEEDDEEVEILKELQEEVKEMGENSKDELAQLLTEVKKIKSQIADKNKEKS